MWPSIGCRETVQLTNEAPTSSVHRPAVSPYTAGGEPHSHAPPATSAIAISIHIFPKCWTILKSFYFRLRHRQPRFVVFSLSVARTRLFQFCSKSNGNDVGDPSLGTLLRFASSSWCRYSSVANDSQAVLQFRWTQAVVLILQQPAAAFGISQGHSRLTTKRFFSNSEQRFL